MSDPIVWLLDSHEYLQAAFRYLFTELVRWRGDVEALTGQTWGCDCRASSAAFCDECRQHCSSFADGCLMVLERDFVQLLHGELGVLLDNRPGVQFLLAGCTLGLLYESVRS